MINVVISNKIYIKNPPEDVTNLIKRSLTLPNPVYQVMLRKHNIRALYAVKKDFKYYRENKELGLLVIGRGCEGRLKRRYGDNLNISYKVANVRLSKPFKSSGLVLRTYQTGVPEEILKNENGIIKLGTAWGKTIIALKLIEKLQLTALIIVPRNAILNQFKEEIKKYYNYEPGIIQGQTWNIKNITLASMATLKHRDISKIARRFSIVFADEAHTTISAKGISVLQGFNPKYLYGLTATPDRSDGQGNAIGFTFGDIIIDKELPQKKPVVQIVKSDADIEVEEYADMIFNQVKDEKRNNLIVRSIFDEYIKGRKILVLTKRIQHYKNIESMLKGYCYEIGDSTLLGTNLFKIFQISSSDKQGDRDKLLTKLRNNEKDFDIILGTYSMLSTGVDIPALDTLFFAGDLKSSVLTQQSVGRILRIFRGKKDPKLIDIDDNLNGILHRQAQARRRFYKKNNWEIL